MYPLPLQRSLYLLDWAGQRKNRPSLATLWSEYIKQIKQCPLPPYYHSQFYLAVFHWKRADQPVQCEANVQVGNKMTLLTWGHPILFTNGFLDKERKALGGGGIIPHHRLCTSPLLNPILILGWGWGSQFFRNGSSEQSLQAGFWSQWLVDYS